MSVEQAVDKLKIAERSWHAALKKHRLAPPDAGYPQRLDDLADACAEQRDAYAYAAETGLSWDPLLAADITKPPYELQPISGRRGDPKLWQQFDLASDRHAKALQGTSLAAIGEAFGEISQAARAIARDVADHATSARKHA